jgi:hypothetical protein
MNQPLVFFVIDLAAQPRHLDVDHVVERRRASRLFPTSRATFRATQSSLLAEQVFK